MFSTEMGSTSDGAMKESSSGNGARYFVNYLNVQKQTYEKIPFGIAQIGKALP